MERYVAVDNVCAWPNLTLMPDGVIIATIFNQPTHGGWEGDIECWASMDRGRMWSLCGVPAPHEPGTNRMNVAAGCDHDGNLIVLASGWSRRNTVGHYSSPSQGNVLPIWACRSEDSGVNWDRKEAVTLPAPETQYIIPFGDIVKLPDGSLGACIYSWVPPHGHNSYFYTSSDQGRKWAVRGQICEGNVNETTAMVLADGRILAAVRTVEERNLELFESDDGGATWAHVRPLTLGGQHPGHLLLLADGRILLSHGIRNKGLYGIGVRFSNDGGRSWEAPQVLLDFETATDGGYPASVQTDDGMIATAYYCNRVPAHHRYHMGIVFWDPETDH